MRSAQSQLLECFGADIIDFKVLIGIAPVVSLSKFGNADRLPFDQPRLPESIFLEAKKKLIFGSVFPERYAEKRC